MNIKKTRFITAFYIVAVVGLLSFSAISVIRQSHASVPHKIEIAALDSNTGNQAQEAASPGELSIFSEVLNSASLDGETNFSNRPLEIFSRLFFAVMLSAILAFRPMKKVPIYQRNFHVAQTQILLAVVAASLMMIVGNNAARAFAIFAAVSLVRFRTNVKNPKDITVLLVSLAIGLSAGVGYWQLGMMLCFFVIVLLWFLELNEDEKAFRSMELTVKTQNTNETQYLLKDAFEKHNLDSELRRIDLPCEENDTGKITYLLNVPLKLSTDALTEQIIYADSVNICDVKWNNKRKALQIYE
jgi:uncharacterized membrane protein YhiD involved in acid resistance